MILHIQYQNLKIEHRAIIGTVDQFFASHLVPHVKLLQPIKYHRMTIAGNGVHARDQGSNYQRGKATPADMVAGKCLKTN